MTAVDCCTGCAADRCLISGKGYCAHPRNGGLQSPEMCSTDAVKRFETAQKTIGKKLVR